MAAPSASAQPTRRRDPRAELTRSPAQRLAERSRSRPVNVGTPRPAPRGTSAAGDYFPRRRLRCAASRHAPEYGPESPARRAQGSAALAPCAAELASGFAARTLFRVVPLPGKTGSVPPFTQMFAPFSRSEGGSSFEWNNRADFDPSPARPARHPPGAPASSPFTHGHPCPAPNPDRKALPTGTSTVCLISGVSFLSTAFSGNLPYLWVQRKLFHFVFFVSNFKTILSRVSVGRGWLDSRLREGGVLPLP